MFTHPKGNYFPLIVIVKKFCPPSAQLMLTSMRATHFALLVSRFSTDMKWNNILNQSLLLTLMLCCARQFFSSGSIWKSIPQSCIEYCWSGAPVIYISRFSKTSKELSVILFVLTYHLGFSHFSNAVRLFYKHSHGRCSNQLY